MSIAIPWPLLPPEVGVNRHGQILLGRAWASPTLASRTVEFSYIYIIYYISVVCRSVNAGPTLLTQNVAHAVHVQVRTEYWKIILGPSTQLYSSLELLSLNSEFYLHRFRLQVLLSMDTQSSYRRALKPAQKREVAEDWRRPRNERVDRVRRAAETSEQRSEKAKGEKSC